MGTAKITFLCLACFGFIPFASFCDNDRVSCLFWREDRKGGKVHLVRTNAFEPHVPPLRLRAMSHRLASSSVHCLPFICVGSTLQTVFS